jgi:hypothetical protein
LHFCFRKLNLQPPPPRLASSALYHRCHNYRCLTGIHWQVCTVDRELSNTRPNSIQQIPLLRLLLPRTRTRTSRHNRTLRPKSFANGKVVPSHPCPYIKDPKLFTRRLNLLLPPSTYLQASTRKGNRGNRVVHLILIYLLNLLPRVLRKLRRLLQPQNPKENGPGSQWGILRQETRLVSNSTFIRPEFVTYYFCDSERSSKAASSSASFSMPSDGRRTYFLFVDYSLISSLMQVLLEATLHLLMANFWRSRMVTSHRLAVLPRNRQRPSAGTS